MFFVLRMLLISILSTGPRNDEGGVRRMVVRTEDKGRMIIPEDAISISV